MGVECSMLGWAKLLGDDIAYLLSEECPGLQPYPAGLPITLTNSSL